MLASPEKSPSFDYLHNSIDTTFITVYSVADAEALNNKLQDFKIQFMVNSTEGSDGLIPLYMVNRQYSELETMDAAIRQSGVVSLPKLPDASHFLRIDPINWDTQKIILRMYIAELCRVMKQNRDASYWHAFADFFSPDDSHDMSRKEATVVATGSRALKKSPKLVHLIYDTIEGVLTVDDGTKPEVYSGSDLQVTREGQMLTIGRKKKKTFKNRHFNLYCESVQDAEEWEILLGGEELDEVASMSTKDTRESKEAKEPPKDTTSLHSGNTESTPTSSSGKWYKMKRHEQSGSNHSSPRSKGTISKRISRSMDSLTQSQQPVPDPVLEFKAVPYHETSNTANLDVRESHIETVATPPTNAGVFQQVDAPTYFGTTLQQAYEACPKYKLEGRPVPSIVYQCIKYLQDNNAVFSEGVFRLNGMMSEVNRIQRVFNDKYDCNLAEVKPDVHSVATLFKRFLRTLKVTVIPEEEATQLMQLSMRSGNDTLAQFKQVIHSLPKINYDVLYVLFHYLQEVLKYKEVNKMGVGALSVLMAPNLTPFDGAKELSTTLLENYNYIFDV